MPDQTFYMDPERLVEQYHALVKSVASKHSAAHLSADDLYQEGMIGLLEANKRFDPSRGTQFSTYAHYWISKRILSAVGDEVQSPADPSTLEDVPDTSAGPVVDTQLLSRLPKDMPVLERQVIILSYEKSYTIAQIADRLDISRERVKQLRGKALRRLRTGMERP